MTQSLFQPEDLLKVDESTINATSAFQIYLEGDKVIVSLGKVKQALQDTIGDIAGKKDRMVISNNSWSMHDLLFYLLEQTGPAKVHFTTWQIGERAIRMMSEAMKTGLITELNSILDRRIRIRRSEALAFTQNVCNNVCLVDCHAKIALIENDLYHISVFSSANFTKNARIEFYIIYFQSYIFDFNLHWLTDQIKGASPFNCDPDSNQIAPDSVPHAITFSDLRRKTSVHKRNPFYFTSFYDNVNHIELSDLKIPANVPVVAQLIASLLNINFADKSNVAIYTTPKRHNKDFHYATAICKEVSRLTKIKFHEDVFRAKNLNKLALDEFIQIRELPEPVLILIDDILTTGRTISRCIIPKKTIFYYIGINNNI